VVKGALVLVLTMVGAALVAAPAVAGGRGPGFDHGSRATIKFALSPLVVKAARALDDNKPLVAVRLAEQVLDTELLYVERVIVRNTLCVARTLLHRYRQAIAACNRLIRLAPADWRFYNNRANAWLQGGSISREIRDYRKALRLAGRAPARQQKPAGGEKTSRIRDILGKNLALAKKRQALKLEGIPVGGTLRVASRQ